MVAKFKLKNDQFGNMSTVFNRKSLNSDIIRGFDSDKSIGINLNNKMDYAKNSINHDFLAGNMPEIDFDKY